MRKERIGLDYDGVLTRPIPPMGFLLRNLNSRIPKIFRKIFFFFFIKCPIYLNRKRLETLRAQLHRYKFYVISGRKDQNLVDWSLREYWDIFEEIITRKPKSKITPWEFKTKVIKAMDLDWYFDDNLQTISYLRSKRIKAVNF